MKRKGCSIIFVNNKNEVLLFLRDDRADIPCPGMWDVPGGHVEHNETPEQAIAREMKEEIDFDLIEFQLFSAAEFPERIEYTYWTKTNLDISRIHLTEGQALRWFSEQEIEDTELAFGFNQILNKFFKINNNCN